MFPTRTNNDPSNSSQTQPYKQIDMYMDRQIDKWIDKLLNIILNTMICDYPIYRLLLVFEKNWEI